MLRYLVLFITIVAVLIDGTLQEACGCKQLRGCYKDMLNTLQDRDEEPCVEDASIGVSTVMIFLKAIKQFCSDIITIKEDSMTYEGRHLYEVVLHYPRNDSKTDENVIVIEAGQLADTESVGLALHIIEQLTACEENTEIIRRAKWVILPSVNPDGMEYARYNRVSWKKNVRPAADGLSYGVDISRNFDTHWGTCEAADSGFSPDFPGLAASSENETMFIKGILSHYKQDIKLYISIRRDGHSLLYPHAYRVKGVSETSHVAKVAGDVAVKINQRAGGVQLFINESIYKANGKPHCGHSVDYAFDAGVPLAFELRVFLGYDNRIMSKFQQMPRGYENSLRMGYMSGLREFYNAVTFDKKIGKVF